MAFLVHEIVSSWKKTRLVWETLIVWHIKNWVIYTVFIKRFDNFSILGLDFIIFNKSNFRTYFDLPKIFGFRKIIKFSVSNCRWFLLYIFITVTHILWKSDNPVSVPVEFWKLFVLIRLDLCMSNFHDFWSTFSLL